MEVIDVDIAAESQRRYLTYALSVVSSRALPDVRDGLKPVQRRILYAMLQQLNLTPEKHHRKSAAVVGEVLARFHPHGDSACYEAMVRMAQDFSLRYPLVDGQGNFGSLDGDAAAAYRYTEARLAPLALEILGDIGQETVAERENFDQTIMEPVVLPARLPNLLMNGASGIAVGMATAIPPHNLKELVKALLILLEDDSAPDTKLFSAIKGPDFPTGCEILNTPAELREIYRTGRGPIRMRGAYKVEESKKGKSLLVITSIPYGIDKSALVEKIADCIVGRRVPQLVDVRDESTDDVRVVLELAPGADPEKAIAYLYKHTTLQQSFHVNMTALVPTANPLVSRPELLSLRDMLLHFVRFRVEVLKKRLLFEKGKLEDRIHLLEGLMMIIDVLDEVIAIVRKSDGRADAASRLQARFGLSEAQSLFVVDLRMYQLSKTSVTEIRSELKEKGTRVAEIKKLVGSEQLLRGEVAGELSALADRYGDARRSPIIAEFTEVEFDRDEYVQHELSWVVVTRDGWLKRIRATNDPSGTRIREGDALSFTAKADTRDALAIISTQGNLFVAPVFDLPATTGFGDPVQKMFKFQDGEQIACCLVIRKEQFESGELAKHELLLCTERGIGFRMGMDQITPTKKSGKRLMKVSEGDQLKVVTPVSKDLTLVVSADGYSVLMLTSEVPKLTGAGKGVLLVRVPDDDRVVIATTVAKKSVVKVQTEQGAPKEIDVGALTLMGRAKRGLKLVKRGLPVIGLATVPDSLFAGLVDGQNGKKA